MKLDDVKHAKSISEVAEIVAGHHGMKVQDLIVYCRQPKYLRPRQFAMYAAFKLGLGDKTAIGAFFERDQSTVNCAIRSVEGRLKDKSRPELPIEQFEAEVLRILADGPMLASEICDRVGHGVNVHHAGCRLRWMRAENKIDSLLSARSTVWGLPGAFDVEEQPEEPEEPESAPERPLTRLLHGVSVPIEPWRVEAAE